MVPHSPREDFLVQAVSELMNRRRIWAGRDERQGWSTPGCSHGLNQEFACTAAAPTISG